jgi:hypothetical protein
MRLLQVSVICMDRLLANFRAQAKRNCRFLQQFLNWLVLLVLLIFLVLL